MTQCHSFKKTFISVTDCITPVFPCLWYCTVYEWSKNVALHGYNIIFTKHFCNWWQRRWISMQKLLPHHTTQPVLVNKSSDGLITSNLGYFNCKLLHCVSLRRQWDAAEYRRSNQVTNVQCYLTTGPCNRHIP